MELIQTMVLEVPLWQMLLLLTIMAGCLFIGRTMLGLSIAILWVMYWGYVVNFDKFAIQPFNFNSSSLSFILFAGINVLLVAVIFIYTFSLKD